MSLYSLLARRALFAFDAELAHDVTLRTLSTPFAAPLLTTLLTALAPAREHPSLQQDLLGLRFRNPLGLAAGLDKQGRAVRAWGPMGFGFAEIGTITPRPQPGNPRPRLFRLPADHAVVNRFGFNSDGADAVAASLSRLGATPAARGDSRAARLGINIGKNKETPNAQAADDYVRAVTVLHPFADYFVVNVSSPNTSGLRALQDGDSLRPLIASVVDAVARAASRSVPVLVKVSPDMTDAELLATVDAALDGGAVGIVATNTTVARDGLATAGRVTAEAGGLSGAPLRERARQACRLLFKHLGGRVPIIGVGGIFTADEAYARVRDGANLIQIYTGLIYEGPALVRRIVDGLAARLDRDGFKHLEEAVGVDVR